MFTNYLLLVIQYFFIKSKMTSDDNTANLQIRSCKLALVRKLISGLSCWNVPNSHHSLFGLCKRYIFLLPARGSLKLKKVKRWLYQKSENWDVVLHVPKIISQNQLDTVNLELATSAKFVIKFMLLPHLQGVNYLWELIIFFSKNSKIYEFWSITKNQNLM